MPWHPCPPQLFAPTGDEMLASIRVARWRIEAIQPERRSHNAAGDRPRWRQRRGFGRPSLGLKATDGSAVYRCGPLAADQWVSPGRFKRRCSQSQEGLRRSRPALTSGPRTDLDLRDHVGAVPADDPSGSRFRSSSTHANGRSWSASDLWCVQRSATAAIQFSRGARTRLVGDSAGAVGVAKAHEAVDRCGTTWQASNADAHP
jgi:hypothetical protein